jgi:hypothetical protein
MYCACSDPPSIQKKQQQQQSSLAKNNLLLEYSALIVLMLTDKQTHKPGLGYRELKVKQYKKTQINLK